MLQRWTRSCMIPKCERLAPVAGFGRWRNRLVRFQGQRVSDIAGKDLAVLFVAVAQRDDPALQGLAIFHLRHRQPVALILIANDAGPDLCCIAIRDRAVSSGQAIQQAAHA